MPKNEYMCDCDAIHQELVDEVSKKMPANNTFLQIADFYKIMGDLTRCKIIFALQQTEMCVCDLAKLLSMTKSSVSHQLKKMRQYGVVKYRRSGKEVYYSLDDEHIDELLRITMVHISHKGGTK